MNTLPSQSRKSENLVLISAWAVFTTALIVVVRHHEPFIDEAHAWLIARDSSLRDIFFNIGRYNGTPVLWYVALWVLIKLKLPYVVMSYFSVALASCAAAVFLRFAPFPVALRILFIFGYFPAYQYSIIARSYVLNVLFFVLAASLFSTRLSKPWRYCLVLAAMANANAYGFISATVVLLEFASVAWRSRPRIRRFLLPVLFAATAGAMAIISARCAPDSGFGMGSVSQFAVMREVAWLLVLCVATFPLAREAGHAALLTAMCGAPAAFAIIIYAQVHHTGLIYLAWIFVMWVSWPALPMLSDKDRRIVLITIMFMLSLQLYDGLAAWMLDIRYPYSSAPAAAAKLHQYLQTDPHPKLACVGYEAFTVQPYFDQNVCDNYYGGGAKPAFYDLKKGDPMPYIPRADYLRTTIQSQQFALVLVSDFTITRQEAGSVADPAGYCSLGYFDGRMIWKDSFTQNDGLTIFRKCGHGSGAGKHP